MEPNLDNQHISTSEALDDEQRVKVLSPGTLVFKRFIRNKLAITGAFILIAMFVFSFIGGLVMPYGQTESFRTTERMYKDYASIARNTAYRYTEKEGVTFPLLARAEFMKSITDEKEVFSSNNKAYMREEIGEQAYIIHGMDAKVNAVLVRRVYELNAVDGFNLSEDMKTAFTEALAANQTEVSFGGTDYFITGSGREWQIGVFSPIALASFLVYDTYDPSYVTDYDFCLHAELALGAGQNSFSSNGGTYRIDSDGEVTTIYVQQGGAETAYANISDMVVSPYMTDTVLTVDFKAAAKNALSDKAETFIYEEDGETGEYMFFVGANEYWTIKRRMDTEVIKMYAPPSGTHLLGTDGNGMDVLTRLMYGGRVSLIIGFIVVIIEIFIGIILGGVAGYFGKWVDNLLMRVVDVFNCIPSLPLMIIVGAVMDKMRMDPTIRIMYLMIILGLLGWPGIARMVRGQILSLREQEFMTATEATGISVSRRIFRHLIPNVIPQLIVISTMSLGGIILTEAVLSFLGLGVKYPFASWGNIINDVSTIHQLTNYGYIWIPAGFCILVTVLGFNFVGDGLRDAFDPKMKR